MCVNSPQYSLKRNHNSLEEFTNRENSRSAPSCIVPKICDDKSYRLESPSAPQVTILSPASTSSSQLEVSFNVRSPSRPLKKPKISHHEDISQNMNKEEKELRKAEEKAQKEKERERKDAERKRKDAERETKRLAHEADKQAREEKRKKAEEVKKKKEEERLRKERSQMKLGSFFARPPLAHKIQGNDLDNRKGNVNVSQDLSTNATPIPSGKTPYQILFPEFFIQTGVTLAPSAWWENESVLHRQIQETLDGYIVGAYTLEKPATIQEMLKISKTKNLPRGKLHSSTRDIIEEFYLGKSNRSRDQLLPASITHAQQSRDLLHTIPVKSLKFQEDVRPPYIGTFTSRPICGTAKLARNPLRRALPNIDYDYDSEAEWYEDEDGEDLKSSDEDEDLDDDEDMNGFLDDEDDDIVSRPSRMELQGDLQPISTGLCWETGGKQDKNSSMASYRMEIILYPSIDSIDPFSTSYWATESREHSRPIPSSASNKSLNHDVANPLPIKSGNPPVTNICGSLALSIPQHPASSQAHSSIKLKDKETLPKKLLAQEDIEQFKTAVAGSDLSKVGLIEVLKKKFPGRPAATIKATLEKIAKRGEKGQREVDKRWIITEPSDSFTAD
ncbi:hypothetical protein K3495_g10068 [Podosphaera aphanis]|nr:hypothetical protein K3495_g10068 [Podosphaera aphanis]